MTKTRSTRSLADTEYSLEFFGYSHSSVQEDFERRIYAAFNSNTKALQKKLSLKCKTDESKENVENCFKQFKQTFQNNSKKHIEEFNGLVSELIKIAPHVLFKEDEEYRNIPDDTSDNINIDAEIKHLENEYKKTQLLKLLAQSKLKMLKEIESTMLDVGQCKQLIDKLNKSTS
uniref:Uncharacterized protein n=1 Tax=Cacopsylla melanoneura TaxID=428564 RepID=A0A8D8WLD8_9HEMI